MYILYKITRTNTVVIYITYFIKWQSLLSANKYDDSFEFVITPLFPANAQHLFYFLKEVTLLSAGDGPWNLEMLGRLDPFQQAH